ncbi:MAG: glycosyltransferase [Myxococcota bacterium]
MATLSICVLFRRDCDALHACLRSVDDPRCDLVVIDTGEQLGPPSVPESIPVVRPPWDGDEGRLRQRAALVASGTHVLYLDGTDVVAPGALDAIFAQLESEPAGIRLPVVESDSARPNVPTVVQGAGRLGEPGWPLRVVRKDLCRTWRGVREPRVEVPGEQILAAAAWIVSTAMIRETQNAEAVDEAWIRAANTGPMDPVVLAKASRRMVDRGRLSLAESLAHKALSVATVDEGLVEATVAAALCALQLGRPAQALDLLRQGRAQGADHPDLDLLMGLAGLELDTDESLAMAESHLRAALDRDGECQAVRPLPGATSSAARVGLATAVAAQGQRDKMQKIMAPMAPNTRRTLAGRLLQAEAALDADEPHKALKLLVHRLENSGADGWILAADAAHRVGRTLDALAFVDRAEERLPDGLIAPHRRRRLHDLRALIAAGAVRDRLTGEASPMPDVQHPRLDGEAAATHGQPEQAHALLIEALRREPGDVAAWNDLGVVFHEAGASEPAALALRMAVELAPERSDLRVQLAAVNWAGGHVVDATTQARAALAIEECPDARTLLQALDVEGPARASVAIVASDARAEDLAAQVRLGRCRPALPHGDLMMALDADPRAQRLAWLDAVSPTLVLLDDHPEADAWIQACARRGHRVVWVGLGPAPSGVHTVDGAEDADKAQALLPILAGATRRHTVSRPRLSVVVATCAGPSVAEALLDRLALQDVPPSLMEVVLVHYGDKKALERISFGDRPYSLRVVRASSPSPAAALNAGIEEARGESIWFLTDTARPALDCARLHLVAQAMSETASAFVGGMRLLERHRHTVWDHVVDTGVLHPQRTASPLGEELDWSAFAVQNTSAPRAVLRELGGFAADSFPDGVYDDVELGLRMQRAGVSLIRRLDLHCGQDARTDLVAWETQAVARGRAQWALHALHGAFGEGQDLSALPASTFDALRSVVEARAPSVAQARHALRRLAHAKLPADPEARKGAVDRALRLAQIIGDDAHHRGLIEATSTRVDVGGLALRTTSIVLVHDPVAEGADAQLGAILEGLRQNTAGPVEVVVVHAGEPGRYLAGAKDIRKIEVVPGTSALNAWERGIAHTSGACVLLCDDDVLFTPGWRTRTLEHMEAWPDVGMVAALGARARSDLDAAAVSFTADHRGQHAWPAHVALNRTMVRRTLLDEIGGPEPKFGGLAAHDWALRARLAGFRVRLAADVLLGAKARVQTPTAADHRAFRTRYGPVPPTRDGLLRLAESTAFEPSVHRRLPGVGMTAPVVLLAPGSRPAAVAQSGKNRELDALSEVAREPVEESANQPITPSVLAEDPPVEPAGIAVSA